uniref:Uncharacterized protein n=1 Tax=Knipowitschia caucasica TaxID=637954 RepID=A0AAV2KA98_KNICA
MKKQTPTWHIKIAWIGIVPRYSAVGEKIEREWDSTEFHFAVEKSSQWKNLQQRELSKSLRNSEEVVFVTEFNLSYAP